MSGWNFHTLSAICEEAAQRGVPAAKYAAGIGYDDLEGLELLRVRDRLLGFQADAIAAGIERAERRIQEFAREKEHECGGLLDGLKGRGDRK